jgi:hypothetical protein
MKKILSMQELVDIIERREDVYQEVNGRIARETKVDFVTLLRMRLIDLMDLIRNGQFYYESDH